MRKTISAATFLSMVAFTIPSTSTAQMREFVLRAEAQRNLTSGGVLFNDLSDATILGSTPISVGTSFDQRIIEQSISVQEGRLAAGAVGYYFVGWMDIGDNRRDKVFSIPSSSADLIGSPIGIAFRGIDYNALRYEPFPIGTSIPEDTELHILDGYRDQLLTPIGETAILVRAFGLSEVGSVRLVAVPEPASLATLLLGVGAFWFIRKRNRMRASE